MVNEKIDYLIEILNQLKGETDITRAAAMWSEVESVGTDGKDECVSVLKDSDVGVTSFPELSKIVKVMDINKVTLLESKIRPLLTESDKEALIKITDTGLKKCGRKDLLTDEYKSVSVVRQVRIETLKAEEKSA